MDGQMFDSERLDLIHNFLNEFETLYGKYVPKEELLDRISKNLKKLKFVDPFVDDDSLGYDFDTKTISLSIYSDDEELRAQFFREILPCIRYNPNTKTNGFVELKKRGSVLGVGFEEGFCQYIANVRNYEIGKTDNGYERNPVLSSLVYYISCLYDKDTFFHLCFNNVPALKEDISQYIDDVDKFFYCFDIISYNENQMRSSHGDIVSDMLKAVALGERNYPLLEQSKHDLAIYYEKIMSGKFEVITYDDFDDYCMHLGAFYSVLDCSYDKDLIFRLFDLGLKANISDDEIKSSIDSYFDTSRLNSDEHEKRPEIIAKAYKNRKFSTSLLFNDFKESRAKRNVDTVDKKEQSTTISSIDEQKKLKIENIIKMLADLKLSEDDLKKREKNLNEEGKNKEASTHEDSNTSFKPLDWGE